MQPDTLIWENALKWNLYTAEFLALFKILIFISNISHRDCMQQVLSSKCNFKTGKPNFLYAVIIHLIFPLKESAGVKIALKALYTRRVLFC